MCVGRDIREKVFEECGFAAVMITTPVDGREAESTEMMNNGFGFDRWSTDFVLGKQLFRGDSIGCKRIPFLSGDIVVLKFCKFDIFSFLLRFSVFLL